MQYTCNTLHSELQSVVQSEHFSFLFFFFPNKEKASYVYWAEHHLTSWINWTNLMSLYESFLLLNVFRMLLHSSSRADDCMRVHCSVSVCTAPVQQYTPKQSSIPAYSIQLLRMYVITFETCWAIKTFIKWHQVRSIYSTTKKKKLV